MSNHSKNSKSSNLSKNHEKTKPGSVMTYQEAVLRPNTHGVYQYSPEFFTPPRTLPTTVTYTQPHAHKTYTGTQYPNSRRTTVTSRVVCFDKAYAKSKQGIFKVVQFIISWIAWICIACTPYNQRLFVQGQTWPFHMVMTLDISAWLSIGVLYILFISGYHRRRKRKPWPTYELYFNATLILVFFTAAMIESFNVWRWNYGPNKNNNGYHHNPNDMYEGTMNNQNHYGGWNPAQYCRVRRKECYEYVNAVIYYNSYFATHIIATICLWLLFVIFIGSTYHAYTLHLEYADYLSGGGNSTTTSGPKSSKFSVGRMKKKQGNKGKSRATSKTNSSTTNTTIGNPKLASTEKPEATDVKGSVNQSVEV